MYPENIKKEEANDFINFLSLMGIYEIDKDGNYKITLKGKKSSDNDGYIHGLGEFYKNRGDY